MPRRTPKRSTRIGRVLQGTVLLLLGVASCREVDPTGGGLDRLFAERDPIPAEVDTGYDGFVAACQDRDASAAWVLMTPRMQARVDARAREEAVKYPFTGLRDRYGFSGPAAAFDGTAYLQGLMARSDEANPCPLPQLWRRIDAGADADGYVVVAERADGKRQALRFAQQDGAWRIDALSTPRSDLH